MEETQEEKEVTHELVRFKDDTVLRLVLHARMKTGDICMDEGGVDFFNRQRMTEVGTLEDIEDEFIGFEKMTTHFCTSNNNISIGNIRPGRDYGFLPAKIALLSKSRTDELRRRRMVKPAKRLKEEEE